MVKSCVECDQPRPGFELALPCLFHTTINITPRVHGLKNEHISIYLSLSFFFFWNFLIIYILWRSRDELIRDVLLWTPTHGRAKAGRSARTYIQQLCEDTGCCPEDLPRAMNDREEWRERVRDIRATSATWWWWWWYIGTFQFFNDIYIYIYTLTTWNSFLYIYILYPRRNSKG